MIDYIFITEIEQININIMKCPDFGWDRVNFFLCSWYNAVFWIQCENEVDNTLIVLFVAK